MGLALPESDSCFRNNIKIKLDDNVYAFFYTKGIEAFDNHTKDDNSSSKAVLSVFYKNPQTENYHQIARFVAANSISDFFKAIDTRKRQLRLIADHKKTVNKMFENVR